MPGLIDAEGWRGSNRLLRDGATPILEGEDVLRLALPSWARPEPPPVEPVPEFEPTGDGARVLRALRERPQQVDALARKLGLSPAALAPVLLELELVGSVRRRGSLLARVPDSAASRDGAG